jgi:hypothetical protein
MFRGVNSQMTSLLSYRLMVLGTKKTGTETPRDSRLEEQRSSRRFAWT